MTPDLTELDRMLIYVASRASIPERSAMWRRLRDEQGWPIISTWIDEAGEGETASFAELWARIEGEIRASKAFILYAERNDFPLKGALIEVGMALGMGKEVAMVLPDIVLTERTARPVGSWIHHPNCYRLPTLEAAIAWLESRER